MDQFSFERSRGHPEPLSFAQTLVERMVFHLTGLATSNLFPAVAQGMPRLPHGVPPYSVLLAEGEGTWMACAYIATTEQYALTGCTTTDGTRRWGLYTSHLTAEVLSNALHTHGLYEEDMIGPLNEIDRMSRALHGFPA